MVWWSFGRGEHINQVIFLTPNLETSSQWRILKMKMSNHISEYLSPDTGCILLQHICLQVSTLSDNIQITHQWRIRSPSKSEIGGRREISILTKNKFRCCQDVFSKSFQVIYGQWKQLMWLVKMGSFITCGLIVDVQALRQCLKGFSH